MSRLTGYRGSLARRTGLDCPDHDRHTRHRRQIGEDFVRADAGCISRSPRVEISRRIACSAALEPRVIATIVEPKIGNGVPGFGVTVGIRPIRDGRPATRIARHRSSSLANSFLPCPRRFLHSSAAAFPSGCCGTFGSQSSNRVSVPDLFRSTSASGKRRSFISSL